MFDFYLHYARWTDRILMVNRENFGGAHMSSIVVVGTQWGDEGKGLSLIHI